MVILPFVNSEEGTRSTDRVVRTRTAHQDGRGIATGLETGEAGI